VPVIFLTARNTELDRVLGLELGGDDYLAKPFSPRELTARVKAILRRTNAAGCEVGHGGAVSPKRSELQAANYTRTQARSESRPHQEFAVDEERCAIAFRGKPLDLTRYEFRLLKTLVARPGRVFSREQLLSAAWEDPGASLDRTVDAHIKTLRAKLRVIAPESDPIQTHRGMGYSLRDAR
jgi:two-component system catabolic regulation response regulator CreB